MNDAFYSAVTLDGKELKNLTVEQIKDLFLKRQINQNSLVFSPETQNWTMLKRVFDVSQWISSGAGFSPSGTENPQNQFSPPNHSEPSNSINPAQNEQWFQTNNSSQSAANNYSQNNQTNYFNQPNSSASKFDFSNKFKPTASGERAGARQAAVFIGINAVFFVGSMIVGSLFDSAAGADGAEKVGYGVGRSIIPLIIDVFLASRLWKGQEIESTRKWVLFRAYFGFIVFGLIMPFVGFNAGEYVVPILSFISSFFYFVSLASVLHGKENPSPSRVMIGVGTFAVYFLFVLGMLSFTFIAAVAPSLGNFGPTLSNLEKYKIEGREFQDKTTGAKITLPEGWTMIELNNPLIHTPEARMIAVDKTGESLTMLEVVPVPGDLDIKEVSSVELLEHVTDYVSEHLGEQTGKSSTFSESGFREITRMSVYIGKHPAKLLVFEKTVNRQKVKGHLIITFDELSLYVLHSWCPAKDYELVQNDFTAFEKSFFVPDKINSPFSQTAEIEKNREKNGEKTNEKDKGASLRNF